MDLMQSILMFVGIWGGLLLYPVLQWKTLRNYKGGWYFLAAIPVVPMGIVLIITLVSIIQGSNLWPIAIIFVAPPALLYLVVIMLAHKLRESNVH